MLKPNRAAPRAFTLIELMIVVAMIGVLSALAVPSFLTQIQAQKVRAAALTVESFLSEARELARRRSQCVDVSVSGQVISFQAWQDCTGLDIDGLGSPTLATALPAFSRSLKLPTLVQLGTFSTGDGKLVFNQSGGTVYTTPTTFEVRNAETSAVIARFTIYPAAGAIRMQEAG